MKIGLFFINNLAGVYNERKCIMAEDWFVECGCEMWQGSGCVMSLLSGTKRSYKGQCGMEKCRPELITVDSH